MGTAGFYSLTLGTGVRAGSPPKTPPSCSKLALTDSASVRALNDTAVALGNSRCERWSGCLHRLQRAVFVKNMMAMLLAMYARCRVSRCSCRQWPADDTTPLCTSPHGTACAFSHSVYVALCSPVTHATAAHMRAPQSAVPCSSRSLSCSSCGSSTQLTAVRRAVFITVAWLLKVASGWET